MTVLLSDTFTRANSATVGGGWTEVEGTGATVEISSNTCLFDSSDNTMEPILKQAFTAQTSGTLTWSFDFNWERTGDEGGYRLHMQLGDSASLSDSDLDAGVGVSLIWTSISSVHESFGSRDGGTNTSIKVVSGAATIDVTVDVTGQTYDVDIDSVSEATDVAFDAAITSIDTVRYFCDALNTENFAGNYFDNINISSAESGRIMGAIAGRGGLAGHGGIAGIGGGIAGD